MKQLICIALLLALTVCAVAEEDLALDMSAAEDISIELDAEDAPLVIAPEEDLLLPEDIGLELSGGDLEPEAEGLTANASEATGTAANGVTYAHNWFDICDAQDGDTIILSPIKGYLQQIGDPAHFKGKDITLDMDGRDIGGASLYTTILYVNKGGELTIAGDGAIWLGKDAVFVEKGGALTLGTAGVGIKIADCSNGVYNSGDFLMTSGSITKCDRGVNNLGGAFVIKGEYPVSITGNKQGVVTYFSDAALTVSGDVKITGNSECDVLLMKDQVVAVGGPLTRRSRIGVTLSDTNLPAADKAVVVTRGLKGNGTANNFVVWGGYEKRINDDGELEVALKATGDPTLPAAPDYTLFSKLAACGNKALKLSWTRVDGAEGYDVFFGKCGGDYKKVTVKNGLSYKLSGLKKAATYRAYVKAWEKVGGKKRVIGEASPTVCAITGGYTKKACNPKAVKLNRTSLKLAVGKSGRIKASVTGVKAHREVLRHGALVRFYSSNANVATVTGNGKVMAMAAGKCTIWAVASNGVRTSVKVTVK